MENITIGQIGSVIACVVAITGGIEFLLIRINKLLDIKLKPLQDELRSERIARLKADLVNYLALAEQGLLIGKQEARFHEEYDEYTNKFKQNSYIHSEYERLNKEGKI